MIRYTFVLSTTLVLISAQSQYQSGGGFGGASGGAFGGAGGFGGGASYDGASDASGAGGSLEETIPGIPGDDYPIFAEVPETSFLCDGQVDGGYYADPEAECQAFHICANDGNGGLTKYSFLCPNGTIFQQQYFVCDWWFNVDCSLAEQLYSLNDEVAAERAANSPPGTAGAGAGGYQGGAANGGGRGGAGGRGGSGGRRGGSGNIQGSASSPSGSYSVPNGGFGDDGFGADVGYGAPRSGVFGGSSLSGYSGRRNARDLELSEFVESAEEEMHVNE